MAELETRCLDAFPAWLKTLGDDARALAALTVDTSLPEASRRPVASALNYLFKSLDLIPDGIEDLGYVDDAFVLREAAAQALSAGADPAGTLPRLAADARLVEEFLGADYARLQRYVRDLQHGAVRGRSVAEIVSDAAVAEALAAEVGSWGQSYQAPTFLRDEKTLTKLRAFLDKKLPA